MTETIIKVENLGKRYTIGRNRAAEAARAMRYRTLSESLMGGVRRLFARRQAAAEEGFWALREVGFSVRRGEVVGIIGRNGAGKSTLLKILSRITEPTEGRVRLRGRVASLLEVGTGFHTELTGRENIYLNGSVLGMSRQEIQAKFDEIVAFSDVEKFLDTPVKRFSSGMSVRLAFAIAAHLEPEILIVDEVLAVGDAEFQKKCLGKMDQVAKSEGRTVLFVSHQMNTVQSFCTRALLLKQGRLVAEGPTADVLNLYLRSDHSDSSWSAATAEPGSAAALQNVYFNPTRFALVDEGLEPLARDVRADDRIGVLIEGHIETLDPALQVGFALYAANGALLFSAAQTDTAPDRWPRLARGHNRLVAWLPTHLLNEGDYYLELSLSLLNHIWLSQPDVNAPGIHFRLRGGLSESPLWIVARAGLLAPVLEFEGV